MLRLTSCQAEIAEPFCRGLARYVEQATGMACEYVDGIPWQERERRLFNGEIRIGWICGLAYVRERDHSRNSLQLLAAPVRTHPRYGGAPVYFSDVVVHSDSAFRSFADLRNRVCAYNEPGSHSGCNVLAYHLAKEGLGNNFFSRFIQSGSHRNSIQMILDGQLDAAAIDSTVLELEIAANPAQESRLRVIEVLGPSPAPPWVIHPSVPPDTIQQVREAFLTMHTHPLGQRMLADSRMLRFAAVDDADYDAIRKMDELAASAKFSLV